MQSALKKFIEKDINLISKYSDQVIKGWKKQNDSGRIKPLDVTNNKITNWGGLQNRINTISNDLFGNNGHIDVKNEDTDTTIRINKKTIKETIQKNNDEQIPANVTEKVLRSSEDLLRTAKYIGSRDNYTADGKYIHFYIDATSIKSEIGTNYDAVVFAVHEAVDSNAGYEKRVYVEEINLIETKKDTPEDPSRMKSEKSAQQSRGRELDPVASSEYSIYDLLDAVNTDQIRYYMKDELQGKNVSFSLMDDTAQMDKEYSAVVKMGRYDLAEKLVDEAAKKAGYTIKAYHGTPNGKFNVFEKFRIGTTTDFGKLGRGFYFTNKKQVADYYAGYLNSSTVMPVYLKMEHPFVLDRNYDNMSVKEFYDSILGKGGTVDEQRSEELTKWLVDNGYDGIVADGEYMVLNPKNIKSAETVTYDKYGDVIPLSERFRTDHEENWKDIDIRFSMRDEDYADAVARDDWTAAENMLIGKMQQTEGITGYRAPYFYAGEHKDIARLIKSGDPDVINSIVDDMAQHVPENAVLVPMPPHEGKVTDSTDTRILAEAHAQPTRTRRSSPDRTAGKRTS